MYCFIDQQSDVVIVFWVRGILPTYLRLESCDQDAELLPLYCMGRWGRVHRGKFWDSSLEYTEYIKPKIQRRHLKADLAIYHRWLSVNNFFPDIFKYWFSSVKISSVKISTARCIWLPVLNCQPFVFVWFFCTVPSPIAEFVSTKPFLMLSDHQWLLVPIMATRVLCPEQKRYPTVWENVVFPILQSEKREHNSCETIAFHHNLVHS
jgi:hypothetical protein